MGRSRSVNAACLRRVKGVPVAVIVVVYPDDRRANGWYFEPILAELLPHSERWGQLGIKFDLLHSERHFREDFMDKAMVQKLRHLNAPLLEKLWISNDDWAGGGVAHCDWSLWDWSHWSTPKLRHIETHNFFPRSLPGLANVSSLTLGHRVDSSSLSGILKEITRMDSLQDFTLNLCSCEETDVERIELFERMEFPRVQRLHILTELHFPFEDRTPAMKRSLFSSLFFPCAVYLHLELGASKYADQDDWGKGETYDFDFIEETYDLHFNKEIHRIFRHVGQFSQVNDFHLKIDAPLGDHHDFNQGFTKLSIPLNMLPNVSYFTLESNTRLDIEEPDNPDEIAFEDERRVAPRVLGGALPALKTITLDMLDAGVVAEWVGGYLETLKDRGELDGFPELVVMEDGGLDGQRKVSYLGDEALDWCSRVDRSEEIAVT